MSQLVNSQLSPIQLILDSSQANYISADGSQATFDLAGNDVEINHSEIHTASVSLVEFHAANTIYNIDETCNKLELYTQFMDAYKVLQPPDETSTFILTVPVGSYNITSLLNVINQKFQDYYGTTRRIDSSIYYFQSFGDTFTAQKKLRPLFLDFIPTKFGDEIDVTNNNGNFKVKFCTPALEKMNVVNGVNVNYAAHDKFYSGFYINTTTHFGLMERLGYPNTKSFILPVHTPNIRGYGVTFSCNLDFGTTTNATYSTNNSANNSNVFTDYSTFSSLGYTKGTGILQASSWPNLDYPRNIYICADSITTRNRCSNQNFPYGTVLQKIPTNQVNFGSIILYEPTSYTEVLVPGLSLDAISIRLFDDDAKPINWNGGKWTLILTVKFNIDVGSAGLEDVSLGRNYRPYLHQSQHDPLMTRNENKKLKR